MNPTRERLLYQLWHLLPMITMAICSSWAMREKGGGGGWGGGGGGVLPINTLAQKREGKKKTHLSQWWHLFESNTGSNTCAQERGRRREGHTDKRDRGLRSVAFIWLLLSFCLVMPRKYLHVWVWEKERDNKQEAAAIVGHREKERGRDRKKERLKEREREKGCFTQFSQLHLSERLQQKSYFIYMLLTSILSLMYKPLLFPFCAVSLDDIFLYQHERGHCSLF